MFEYTMNRVLLEQVAKMRIEQSQENPPQDAEYLLQCIKYNQDFAFGRVKYLPKLFGEPNDSFAGATYDAYLVSASELIKLAIYKDPCDDSELNLKIATNGLLSSAALAVWCIFAELNVAASAIQPFTKYNEYLPLIRVPSVDDKHMMESMYFYQYIIERNQLMHNNSTSFYRMPYPNFKRVLGLGDLNSLASRFNSVYTVGQTLTEGQLNYVLGIKNGAN